MCQFLWVCTTKYLSSSEAHFLSHTNFENKQKISDCVSRICEPKYISSFSTLVFYDFVRKLFCIPKIYFCFSVLFQPMCRGGISFWSFYALTKWSNVVTIAGRAQCFIFFCRCVSLARGHKHMYQSKVTVSLLTTLFIYCHEYKKKSNYKKV